MPTANATTFTAAARVLSQATAHLNLVVPGFRSPPRIVGVNRTVKRAAGTPGGVVAVRVSGRPFTAAIGDMIEGVIVVNNLGATEADAVRSQLWRAMLKFTAEAHAVRGQGHGVPPETRVA